MTIEEFLASPILWIVVAALSEIIALTPSRATAWSNC